MDRYVIREQRSGGEYPEGNQMIAFSATTGNNITMPENVYYGGYVGEIQNANVQQTGAHILVTPHVQAYSPNVIQGQLPSGIDPRYLATYDEDKTAYEHPMRGGNMTSSTAFNTFGNDYENRHFVGADINKRNNIHAANHHFNRPLNRGQVNNTNFNRAQARANLNFNENNLDNRNFNMIDNYNPNFNGAEANNNFKRAQVNNQNFKVQDSNRNFKGIETNVQNFNSAEANNRNFKGAERNEKIQNVLQRAPNVPSKKQPEIDPLKHELQTQVKTRAEKLKELQRTGTRIFSGPVEKILKWHKSIQDIGAMVLYEIVGKCVNVRAGESCAKNLVVRDENGPAIQVVYYEIDFFLPELKPPCTVRVIGRMMPGTNRFQAFNVRPATGDDVATLPRRAAVAAHHVAKLCKEYGVEVLMFK